MNKYSIGAIFLGAAIISISFSPLSPVAFGAAKAPKISVVGMAKFVAKGLVVDVSANSFTFHANSASKNAGFLKAKDQTISAGIVAKITKAGKKVAFGKLAKGTRVKIFGVFDKKSNSVVRVNWIKILP